eukprot:1156448-Rhodomonas_salina.1
MTPQAPPPIHPDQIDSVTNSQQQQQLQWSNGANIPPSTQLESTLKDGQLERCLVHHKFVFHLPSD